MLPVLAVGRNWMWVRYSPTNYINWFGEITWCNMFPMFSYMFSQWPNVFNHLMGNHWCFLERSLRHGNLRDDLSNKAHSTNEELEIYHHHGTKYLEISTNIAPKKNHIQPPHPISSNSTKRRPPHVICLRTSIHHYISRTINSTIIQHHPVLPKWCPEISRKYQRNIATPTPKPSVLPIWHLSHPTNPVPTSAPPTSAWAWPWPPKRCARGRWRPSLWRLSSPSSPEAADGFLGFHGELMRFHGDVTNVTIQKLGISAQLRPNMLRFRGKWMMVPWKLSIFMINGVDLRESLQERTASR